MLLYNKTLLQKDNGVNITKRFKALYDKFKDDFDEMIPFSS